MMKTRAIDAVSPANLRLLILAMGVGVAFFVYSGIDKKVKDVIYTPILGGSVGGGLDKGRVLEQSALPIVIAQSKNRLNANLELSDELIAGAFNPIEEVEEIEIVEIVEPEVKPLEQLMKRHRPQVTAITNRGAVVNGVHYNTGEMMRSIGIQLDSEVWIPKLKRVTSTGVVLEMDGDTEQLVFNY